MNKATTRNNFIINFYNNVEMLMDGYSEYLILLSQLPRKKIGDELIIDEENLSDELLEGLNNSNNNLKFLTHKIHLQILTLDSKKKYAKEETSQYRILSGEQYLKEENIQNYCLLVNSFLMDEIGDVGFEEVATNI